MDVSQVYIPETSVILWCKVVPIKVTCFIWRAVQARIPTTVALDKRGIAVNSLLCSSCIGAVECSEHVLMNCPFATMIRNNILGWCGLSHVQDSLKNSYDLLQLAGTRWNFKKKKERLVAICYGLLWNLWRFRNKRLFQMEGTSPSYGIDCIKSMVFY